MRGSLVEEMQQLPLRPAGLLSGGLGTRIFLGSLREKAGVQCEERAGVHCELSGGRRLGSSAKPSARTRSPCSAHSACWKRDSNALPSEILPIWRVGRQSSMQADGWGVEFQIM